MVHYEKLSGLYEAAVYPPLQHPLFGLMSLVDTTCSNEETMEFTCDFYVVGFKHVTSGEMKYGKTKYDYDLGCMFFFKPMQKISIRDVRLKGNGFLLHFHEDFLMGHPMFKEIKNYSYFDYESNEALHLSPREEEIVWELFGKLETEYHNNPDEFSRPIILSHLDSMFKYASRFYKRQFINRKPLSGTTVTKFNEYLNGYFEKGLVKENGLPTVNHIASELHLSSKYLSDLLKEETGKTSLELIHMHLVSQAKNLLAGSELSISEIAYHLGFENPPYFSRLFKKTAGVSPGQFRDHLLN